VVAEKVMQTENKAESAQPHAIQVGIRMQQGEHTGQPIYANFTAVQGGQGVVFVDFGFLEPQALNSLTQMTQAGNKVPETIAARMSSRMAISVDAAANLARQLNQLLQPKAPKAADTTAMSDKDATLQ
jgi:hypothetical protein